MRVMRLVGIAIGSMLCIGLNAYAQEQAPLPGGTDALPAVAPEAGTSESSSSSYYRRGVGVKDANVFAPKYKQRLQNWRDQLALGLERGFLKAEDGERFKLVLEHLTTLEADVAAKGYPKAELDSMEQEFNAFNVDFTRAMQPKVEPTPPAAAPVTAPPVVAPSKTNVAKPTPTAAVKKVPANKAVAKKVVVKKTVKKRRR